MKKITIGRASDNDLVFNVHSISSYHADVVVCNGRVTITDHSTNGTWINGRKLHHDSCEIREGDRILLPGNVSLEWGMFAKDFTKTLPWDSNVTVPLSSSASKDIYHSSHSHQSAKGYPSYEREDYAIKSMSFGESISSVFSHYADFSGRARRSEYWWFAFLNFILYCIPVLNFLWFLVALIPGLALAVRRLHDIGKSGWFLLLSFIPIVGGIVLIVWYCQDSQKGENEYGVSPKYRRNPHAFKKMNWT